MSDYLGPNQTRVLDPDDRSFEEIIYQKRKPPLSSELNLQARIIKDRDRESFRSLMPSGWLVTGRILDNLSESSAQAGDVICSPNYAANSFKLIALDKGIVTKRLAALVNGYWVLIQGSNSTDENNIITLSAPPSSGSRVDFVFLEVWRKLIEPADVIYKYGNFLYGGTNPTNDLIDPAINIETSLRIQIQYRIRVVEGIDIEDNPEGFDPNIVFVQGPLDEPISTCSHAYFSPVPGDAGLWRAGTGDSVAQETLETVDGYTYAIPMFAIIRRNTGAYDPNSRSNGAGKTLADYLAGYASDRPDNKYSNWIVADDILDLRHRIAPQENYKEISEDGFKKLISGQTRGKIAKSTLGEDHFGTVLVQADAISNIDLSGSNKLPGDPDGIRRAWSNAEVTQPECFKVFTINDKVVGINGTPWASGDAVQITLGSNYPAGSTIESLDEFFRPAGYGQVTLYTPSSLPSSTVTITINGGSNVIGTANNLTAEYTIKMPAGPYGLTAVPNQFYEFRKESTNIPIAVDGNEIRVRTAGPVVTSDGTKYHTLLNEGARITDPYDFGHQMVYHAVGNGTQYVYVDRTAYGYTILGVASALVDDTYYPVDATRNATTYAINLGSTIASGKDVKLNLYTGSKFFKVNRQSRAILDCYEMKELRPIEAADGAKTLFTLDATNQTILAVASNSEIEGRGIAYQNGAQKNLFTTNDGYPLDTTKTRIQIGFITPPPVGADIEVPVLTRSAIGSTEGYTCFYEKTPYQGLLDSTTTGSILAVGSAITTTAGSGGLTDFTYSQGTVTSDSTNSLVVHGSGTEWLSNVRAGDTFIIDLYPTKEYKIDSVYDDDTLFLTTDATWSGSVSYVITRKDQAFFAPTNIIDRLPTYDSDNDSSGKSVPISTAVTDLDPVLETRIISRKQDILDATGAIIGVNSADRGRSTVYLGGSLGLGNLGLSFEKLDISAAYQKTYQSYILNKEDSGRLYLMVVGTETDNTSASRFLNCASNNDSVDIFELPGRPLTARIR